MLNIENLSVSLDGKTLLSDINMTVARGARHLLRGANGSGKSTLVQTIAANPEYTITNGKIIFDGTDITPENTTARALRGIFIGAQNVPEISGLTVLTFLKYALMAHTHYQTGRDLSMGEFLQKLNAVRESLSIPADWLNRFVNVGFSGGERKRLMLLQLKLVNPKFAILDEPDSGADAETQSLIADTIKSMTDTTFLFISHQSAFTDMIVPTAITNIADGKIKN